jgi:flavin reductase (DIM6/NTAB) family NADH-FMN oxidoreductase RutF
MQTAASIDAADLRRAFGRFATGVTVVTAVLPDGRNLGVTVNSFASVSLDPPLVSWNYRLASPHLKSLMECEHFLVHVLSAEQQELCHRMARPADDKFRDLPFERGIGGAPRLPGTLATFECELWRTVEAGDHMIFIGKVVEYCHSDGQALMFVNGQYAPAHAPGQPSPHRNSP